eukprot:CAMPEP_0113687114 /NCGR_PEP_ID=MMETSP0038_2-20120614/15724_1 /TAXON_ID=2898 /ORGANISM="Cryptomonas paramecium" /LENGTH=235 /DNA_ID=CAMNT_0000607629 /DNA_START=290 /DNA_END=994 /DNA_ORIENTATION=+ /assembly_acc=CAM_ASM_000170
MSSDVPAFTTGRQPKYRYQATISMIENSKQGASGQSAKRDVSSAMSSTHSMDEVLMSPRFERHSNHIDAFSEHENFENYSPAKSQRDNKSCLSTAAQELMEMLPTVNQNDGSRQKVMSGSRFPRRDEIAVDDSAPDPYSNINSPVTTRTLAQRVGRPPSIVTPSSSNLPLINANASPLALSDRLQPAAAHAAQLPRPTIAQTSPAPSARSDSPKIDASLARPEPLAPSPLARMLR